MLQPSGPLTAADFEHFLTYGYVTVENCFDTGPGSLARAWLDASWQRNGYAESDPTTWRESKVHMHWDNTVLVKEFAPKAFQAIAQLMGGEDRIADDLHWADSFIVNYSWMADSPKIQPRKNFGGWHKDGEMFLHYLDSPEQGLLVVVLWDDVVADGGPTWVAADSIAPVARWLAEHPEGASPFSGGRLEGVPATACNGMPIRDWIQACTDFRALTGKAGSVALMHPFMLHTASPNWLQRPRFITNPPVAFREPMQLSRPDGAYSAVEQAILRALDVDAFAFTPENPRVKLLAPRLGGRFVEKWDRQ